MTWSGRRVVVTGGAGFIGSHLAEALFDAGAEVTVLDLKADPHAPGITHHRRDIMVGPWPDVSSIDVIFHFAANAYVPPSVEKPLFDFENNCGATVFMLDSLRQQEWKGRLVFASSAAVYGNPAVAPVREDHPTVPVSPYGVGKLAAERYCAVFAQLYGLKIASLRLFSVYGPRQRKQVVWDLMNKIAAEGEAINIHGDGTQTRDFVYVDDVVNAAMFVAEHADMAGEVYNVGSGKQCSIHSLADTLCGIMGVEKRFDYTGVNRPGDPERFVADITRLCELGYSPAVDAAAHMADGLQAAVEWFKQIKELESDGMG